MTTLTQTSIDFPGSAFSSCVSVLLYESMEQDWFMDVTVHYWGFGEQESPTLPQNQATSDAKL